MFKKLKEKIEEVKSSPQRIQQFTQSVTDKLQNSSVPEENFFSIGDEGITHNNHTIYSLSQCKQFVEPHTANPPLEPGFMNVSLASNETRLRRNSNSSVASDVSFLPRYESSPNMYHLQVSQI